MSRRFHLLRWGRFMLLCLAMVAAPAMAQAQDVIPLLYEATRVNQGGSTVMVLVPRTFDRFDPSRVGDGALRAFDLLKSAHAAEYGRSTLALEGDPARPRAAILHLDPERKGDHDRIAAEVFHTLRGLGIPEVRAPLLRQTPLDNLDIRIPAFLMTVPYYDALPPRGITHGHVVLSATEILPAPLFRYRVLQGDPTLMDRILSGLQSPVESIRLSVLAAFPSLKVTSRAARLLPLLEDQSHAVRMAVLKLLEPETGSDVTARLERVVETDRDPGIKLAAARMLSARGVRKYDVLIEMERLGDPSEAVVLDAIGRLVASGNPAVGSGLFQSLKHPNVRVREAARDGLLALGARDLMAQALPDDGLDRPTRERFARDLAGSTEPASRFTGLSWLLLSGSQEGALWAAARLAESRIPEGQKVLLGTLLRPEPSVRAAAMEAIASYRDPASLQPLLEGARTPDDKVLAEAAAIRIIASQNLDAILGLMDASDVTIRRLAMKALGDALQGSAPPPKAVSVLKTRLADPDLGIRRAAVYSLARVPDAGVTASILAMIGDPDAEIREAAVVAAGRTSGPKGDEALIRALDDESERVKRAALEGVAGRGLKAARDPLRLLCRYQNIEVRMSAVKAWLSLLEPGEAASEFDFLRELLFDKEPRIRLMVIPVVAGIRERRALSSLASLVIDPSAEVKMAVLDALAGTGEKDATEGIMKGVFDDDQAIRLAALEALKKLGRKDALDFMTELINLEQDEVIRIKAEEVRQYLLMR